MCTDVQEMCAYSIKFMPPEYISFINCSQTTANGELLFVNSTNEDDCYTLTNLNSIDCESGKRVNKTGMNMLILIMEIY